MLTVTAPAESHSLTTVEAIRAELNVSNWDDDDYLSGLIDQASAAIQSWCCRPLAVESVSETFRLRRPMESLVLARWPVLAIDMIIEAGAALASSDFEAEADKGLLYRLADFGEQTDWCAGKIVIDYQAGYVLPGELGRTLPDDIERAAILLVKAAWFARTRDPMIRSESTPAVYEASYWVGGFGNGATLPPDVEGLLSKHRQPPIG